MKVMTTEKSNYIICPNCENEFDNNFEFCPHCGQKNKDHKLDFKYFVQEFLAGSFNLDSKIFRTLKLLIFYPGKLTKEFIDGKRVAYIPPVRLYLIFSLVYFTLLSFVNSEVVKFTEDPKEANHPIVFGLDSQDTVEIDFVEVGDTTMVTISDSSKAESITQQILKKLNSKEGRKEFNERLPNYISIGMFVLMPLTALIFYLMFFKNTFYIQHLVFVLHLQSAMYILFTLMYIFEFRIDNTLTEIVNAVLFLSLLIIWIKRFYELRWFKTIWKTMVFLFFYGITFLMFIVIVAGINIWLML